MRIVGVRLLGAASSLACVSLACGPRPAGGDAGSAGAAPVVTADAFELASPAIDFGNPDLALGSGGSLGVTWLAFDGEGDQVMAAVRGANGWGRPIRVSEERGSYLTPRLAPVAAGGFVIVWAARHGEQYDLYEAVLDATGVGARERLTTDAGADVEPALAVSRRGEICLVWESFRDGGLDVFARRRDVNGWGPEIRVTDHPRSDGQPTVGFDSQGRPWVAWMSWRDGEYWSGNYEIYAARIDGDRAGYAVRVSTSPTIDMYPELVALDSGLALVWTNAYLRTRTIEDLSTVAYNQFSDKVYQVAFLDGDAWTPPLELRLAQGEQGDTVPVAGDRATPVAGPGGRLWLLFPELVPASRTWKMKLARITEDGVVGDALDVSFGASGPGERFAATWAKDRLWTAESVDNGPPGPPADDPPRRSLRVRSLALDSPVAARPPVARPSSSSSSRPAGIPGLFRDQPGRDRRPLVHHGSRRWSAYFGNLHHHSDFSRDRRGANGTAMLAFRTVYDIADLDFAALTDHVEELLPVDWWEIRKITELWNRPGRFVTFPSYEWTSSLYGHKNVVFPDGQVANQAVTFPARDHTPNELWSFLGDRPAITIPHHVSHALKQGPTDWSFRNDRFQRLVEIFQDRGNYEYDGAPYQRRDLDARFEEHHSVRDALALGHRLGIIASPDHGGGMGLAGVWAEALTRPSLFEALRSRRTFGTTGAKMTLFLTVAGEPQGSEVTAPAGGVRLTAEVHGTTRGLELTLVADGEEREHWHFDGDEATIAWREDDPPQRERYYYLRARQADGHIGWTSPVWVSPSR